MPRHFLDVYYTVHKKHTSPEKRSALYELFRVWAAARKAGITDKSAYVRWRYVVRAATRGHGLLSDAALRHLSMGFRRVESAFHNQTYTMPKWITHAHLADYLTGAVALADLPVSVCSMLRRIGETSPTASSL